MRPGGMMPGLQGDRNNLEPFITILADLNLGPDFNLTVEQETKIAAIRDGFKKSADAWETEHADQVADLRDQMRQMRRGQGGDDRQKVMDSMRDLMLTAPNGDSEVKEIKALLTEDQVKQVETREAAAKAETDRMREEMRQRWGNNGGGRGGNGGGNNGANTNNANNANNGGGGGNARPGGRRGPRN
jgi:hypothetical protein